MWLLVLALPAQGVAAATMVFCGPIHQRMALAGQVQAATVHATHEQHKAHHRVAADAGHQDSAKSAQELPTDQYSCSTCAACCSATAISAPAFHIPDLAFVSSNPVPAPASSFSGFVPDGPEHPPRSILV
jgi:hypothetical protein